MSLDEPTRSDLPDMRLSCAGTASCRMTSRSSPSCRPLASADVSWAWYRFEELEAGVLHRVLRLRQQIFIVEQNVAYPDIDGRDPSCDHLLGRLGQEVVAYMRTLPESLFAPGCFSLGRVVVDCRRRRGGLGSELVRRGLHHLDTIRAKHPIKISSQLYLKDFYASFGFVPKGTPYVEDQILHIEMIRS